MKRKNTIRLSSDGELLEPVPTVKRKSKKNLYPPSFPPLLGVLAGIIGIILLLVIGAIGGTAFVRYLLPSSLLPTLMAFPQTVTATFTATAIPSTTALAIVPTQPSVIPSRTLIPAVPPNSYPTFPLDVPQLIVSVQNGAMYSYSAPTGLTLLSLRGHDVAASSAGKALAYVGLGDYSSYIYVYRDGKQVNLNNFGEHHKPAWAPDGKSLAFLAQGTDKQGHAGDWVYWLKMTSSVDADAPLVTGFAKFVGAPALTDPASGNLLIISNTSLKSSVFSLLDPVCGCAPFGGSEFLSVPYAVNWATYDSRGSRIIFSEDVGNLYLIDTATLKVSPFLQDNTEKHGPTFSPDDKLLAYFDDANHLYIVTMTDKTIHTVSLPDVVDSLTWAYALTKK